MTLHRLIVVSFSVLALETVSGSYLRAEDAQPANDPSETFDAADASPASKTPTTLPAGHPTIPNALPAGHPVIPPQATIGPVDPAKMAGKSLPAGHPQLPAPTTAPGTDGIALPPQMPVKSATLEIRVVQGTPGAAAITAGTPTLELYHEDKLFASMPTPLQEDGHIRIYDVPVDHTYIPVVKMTYAGVEYELVGEAIDQEHTNQDLTLRVYETTPDAPQWVVRMRHLVAQATATQLEVNEVIVIDNPADHTFVPAAGTPAFAFPLPAGASDVTVMSGFGADKMRFENGTLLQPVALLPGQTQYQLAYSVPIHDRAATLSLVAPVVEKNVAVLMPADESNVQTTGLTSAGTTDMGSGVKTRVYKASDVPANQAITIALSNLKVAAADSTPIVAPAVDAASSPSMPVGDNPPAVALKADPQRFAVIGLIVVGVIGMIFAGTRRAAKVDPSGVAQAPR